MKLIRKLAVFLLVIPFFAIAPGTGVPGQNVSTKANFAEFTYQVNYDVNGPKDYEFNNRAPVFTYGTISKKVNSPFGYRYDPITGIRSLHNGVDFACKLGEPIYASAPGKVIISTIDAWGSLLIEVQHSQGISTRYLHQSVNLVNVGDVVARGQQIAVCGQTGRATGPHLHLGLKIDGVFTDILPYLQRN